MNTASTNYQTSFRITSSEHDAFEAVQSIVFGWVTSKEKDKHLGKSLEKFRLGHSWACLHYTKSFLQTLSTQDEHGEVWAMRYSHRDRELRAARFWHTDIGLRRKSSEAVLSVRVSYSWNIENIGTDLTAPQPSVPYFVRTIVEKLNAYTGRREFRLIQKPLPFRHVGQGKALCDFISSPARRYPLLVVNGDSPQAVREANRMATETTGKCLVAIISENVDLAEEIRQFLPADFRINYGHLRVFFPFVGSNNNFTRHRWFEIANPSFSANREALVSGLLRNNILREDEAIESIEDVQHVETRARLIALKLSTDSKSAELAEFFKHFEEVEKQKDEFKKLSDSFASEVDSLEEQVRQISWKNQEMQLRLETLGKRQESERVQLHELLPTLPDSLSRVLKAAGKFYSNLCITPNAVKSAEDDTGNECINETWEILGQLNNMLHRLKFESETAIDLEAAFDANSRYELAMSEGKNTKKDSKLMGLRLIEFEGETFDITPHVKYGNRAPKMVRVHFSFDEDKKRIIVGFVGSHMENATSKRR